MDKLSSPDNQSVTSKKKTSLSDLLNDRYYMENLHDSEIMDEFSELAEKFTCIMPIYNLFELKSICIQKHNSFLNDWIESIIDVRIRQLNKSIQRSIPGRTDITKATMSIWHENIPLEQYDQIVINSSINELARVTKEIPANLPVYKKMTESLNSKIYDHYKKWLDYITKSETLTDIIFNDIQQKIGSILSKYSSKYDFQPYVKRIIFNKFTDYYSASTEQSLNEHDPSFYYVRQSFITFNLILFLKLDSKPHHKLIFWHEYMNYIKKSDHRKNVLKAIDHDAFFDKNSLFSLKILWEKVINRINLNCKELIESKDFFDEKTSLDDALNVLKQFGIFTMTLEKSSVTIYTEKEYSYLREQYKDEQVKHILLIDFLKDTNGELLDNEKIRKLVSNWNNRIKIQLNKVFNYKSKRLVVAKKI